MMTERSPEHYLTRISIAERRGKIFIDYLRNDPTSTAVGAYSTRAREGAPVAAPLAWDELTAKLDPRVFDINSVPKRLVKLKSDPWAGIAKLAQKLPALPA
jgi:bifunctional non-homologous end joining protein LigD